MNEGKVLMSRARIHGHTGMGFGEQHKWPYRRPNCLVTARKEGLGWTPMWCRPTLLRCQSQKKGLLEPLLVEGHLSYIIERA